MGTNKGEVQWIRKEKRKEKRKKERKWEKTNRRERERGGGGGGGGGGGEKNKKRGFHFSLRSTEVRPLVFVGARGKVDPHNEGYVWVPKSESFIKLQEVGNFPTWISF